MNNRLLQECAYTILDNAKAIMVEMNSPNPHASYLLEKAQPILNDIKIIINNCEEES